MSSPLRATDRAMTRQAAALGPYSKDSNHTKNDSIKVIDMAKDATKNPDRFGYQANLIKNKSGSKLALGIQEKPCLRPITASFEQNKNKQNQDRIEKSMKSDYNQPQRHDPYKMYLSNISDKESRRGNLASVAKSIARCHNTQYNTRQQTSPGLKDALKWSPAITTAVAPHTIAVSSLGLQNRCTNNQDARPATAPGMSWDPYSKQRYQCSSPRFTARTEQEDSQFIAAKTKAHMEAADQAKIRLDHHAQHKALEKEREKKEEDAMKEWPHGLPAGFIRKMNNNNNRTPLEAASNSTTTGSSNLRLGSVGYGTISSMKQSQYQALRSTMKQP